jgi:hypothetical protein
MKVVAFGKPAESFDGGRAVFVLCMQRLHDQLENIERILACTESSVEASQGENIAPPPSNMDQILNGEGASLLDGRPVGVPNGGEVRSSFSGDVTAFTPNIYQKLANPLTSQFKDILVVDGTDVPLMCEFLSKVITISNVGQIAVPTIY